MSLFRPSIADLVPYEPGKPVEEVQRELGLERVVKLASNEGPFPPFPAALEAMRARRARAQPLSRRRRLGAACGARRAARRRVRGGDRRRRRRRDHRPALAGDARPRRRDRLRLAVVPELRARRGEARRRVAARSAPRPHVRPRRAARRDRAAHEARLRLPSEQPDRHGERRATSSLAFLDRVPEHVLVVLDQAYFEYIDDPDYADGIGALQARAGASSCCGRSRRSTGSPGCASGYGIAPADVVAATSKVRRAFDVTATAQAAALASIGDDAGARAAARSERDRPRAARGEILREHGLEPVGPALGNFLFADVGGRPGALRAAAARGRDRPPARRLRRAGGDPRLGRHAGGERVLRGRAWDTSFRASRNAAGIGVTFERSPCGFRPASWRRSGSPASACSSSSTLGSSVGTLLAAVALAIDVKDRTNSRPLGRRASLVVEFLPTIVVGLLLGPLLDRLERRSLMVAADAVRVGVFAALPFAPSAGAVVALALVAGLATGFFRPAVYAGVPNLVPDEQLPPRERAPPDGREPQLGGRPAPRRRADGGGRAAGRVLDQRGLVPRLGRARRADPGAAAAERARAHARPLARPRRRLRRRAPLAPRCSPCSSPGASRSLGTGAVNVSEIFLAKNTLLAGDFGYGLLYGAIGAGLVVGSFFERAMLDRARRRARVRRQPRR